MVEILTNKNSIERKYTLKKKKKNMEKIEIYDKNELINQLLIRIYL